MDESIQHGSNDITINNNKPPPLSIPNSNLEHLEETIEKLHQDCASLDELELDKQNLEQLRGIKSRLLGIDSIMRDLESMVHEPGEFIDSIEGIVDPDQLLNHEVEAGTSGLQKSASYQAKSNRRKRRLFCLLATGFIVLILVVIFIILLATQLKS